jgi:hypothetical protein
MTGTPAALQMRRTWRSTMWRWTFGPNRRSVGCLFAARRRSSGWSCCGNVGSRLEHPPKVTHVFLEEVFPERPRAHGDGLLVEVTLFRGIRCEVGEDVVRVGAVP